MTQNKYTYQKKVSRRNPAMFVCSCQHMLKIMMTIIQTFLFYLFDPAVPAEDKLLFAHAAVPGHVEDHEHVGHPLRVQATK